MPVGGWLSVTIGQVDELRMASGDRCLNLASLSVQLCSISPVLAVAFLWTLAASSLPREKRSCAKPLRIASRTHHLPNDDSRSFLNFTKVVRIVVSIFSLVTIIYLVMSRHRKSNHGGEVQFQVPAKFVNRPEKLVGAVDKLAGARNYAIEVCRCTLSGTQSNPLRCGITCTLLPWERTSSLYVE